MPIKTLPELIIQSNDTFADSPPANITPPNHRDWNLNALETMFSIGGRVITKAAFQDLVDNQELVAGTQYLVADFPIPFQGGSQQPVIITATSNSSIDALCQVVVDVGTPQIALCWISQDLSDLKLMSWQGKGDVANFNYGILLTGLSNGWFNYGAELIANPANTTYLTKFLAEVNSLDNSVISLQNITALDVGGQKKTATITNYSQGYLMPNNGGADDWGVEDANGNFKSIEIRPIVNVLDPYPVQNTNFLKVNETVHGTFVCNMEASFGTGDALFDFTLPIPATSSDYVVGHGHFSNSDGHIVLITVEGIFSDLSRAKARMRLYGNHNNPITGEAFITFSYR